MSEVKENIPIPSQAIEISQKIKASNTINQMRLENILLKHLVAIIDPEHDYLMDLERMELTKVRKDAKSKGNPSDSETVSDGSEGIAGKQPFGLKGHGVGKDAIAPKEGEAVLSPEI